MAVDGSAKGRQYTSKTKLGQLWGDVWDEYEACQRHGITIQVIKVKSHETDIDKVPKILQDGNHCADYHAGLVVRECPSGEANRIRNIDSRATWFQERMVQALLLLPKKGRRPNERNHINEEGNNPSIPHITQIKARYDQKRADARMPALWAILGVYCFQHDILRGYVPRPQAIWPPSKRETMGHT